MLTTLEDRENYAQQFLDIMVPGDRGEARFDWLVQDWGEKGTTCGYLTHRMAWALGCRESWVNASGDGGKYVVGHNVIKIANSPHYRRYVEGQIIPRFSILFLSLGPSVTEHLVVFDCWQPKGGSEEWISWEAGQLNEHYKECSRKKAKVRNGTMLGNKRIQGYIPFDKIVPTVDEFNLNHWGISTQQFPRDPFTGKAI